MKLLRCLILLFISVSAFSQVESRNKIVMSSPDSTERTVSGISYPLGPANAVNSGSVQGGQLVYSQAIGVNNLIVNLNPAVLQYVQGMTINFKTSSANTAPVTIQLNGLAPLNLKKNGSFMLDSFDLSAGQMVAAIFDGTDFQIISRLNRKCPSGFVDVNKDYCIELVERDTVNWFVATKICGDLNARLCTQSEWVNACQKAGSLGLLNMIDNHEWVDSAANNPNHCKAVGVDQFGYMGCDAGYTRLWSLNKNYRCCYSK